MAQDEVTVGICRFIATLASHNMTNPKVAKVENATDPRRRAERVEREGKKSDKTVS